MVSLLVLLVSLNILLSPSECRTPLACAVQHVESRGSKTAVSPKGALGLMQVMPVTACSRFLLPGDKITPRWRVGFCRAYGRDIAGIWMHPVMNRAVSRSIRWRYAYRCRRNKDPREKDACMLRAYNCGNKGIHTACGKKYANDVLGRLKHVN